MAVLVIVEVDSDIALSHKKNFLCRLDYSSARDMNVRLNLVAAWSTHVSDLEIQVLWRHKFDSTWIKATSDDDRHNLFTDRDFFNLRSQSNPFS